MVRHLDLDQWNTKKNFCLNHLYAVSDGIESIQNNLSVSMCERMCTNRIGLNFRHWNHLSLPIEENKILKKHDHETFSRTNWYRWWITAVRNRSMIIWSNFIRRIELVVVIVEILIVRTEEKPDELARQKFYFVLLFNLQRWKFCHNWRTNVSFDNTKCQFLLFFFSVPLNEKTLADVEYRVSKVTECKRSFCTKSCFSSLDISLLDLLYFSDVRTKV